MLEPNVPEYPLVILTEQMKLAHEIMQNRIGP